MQYWSSLIPRICTSPQQVGFGFNGYLATSLVSGDHTATNLIENDTKLCLYQQQGVNPSCCIVHISKCMAHSLSRPEWALQMEGEQSAITFGSWVSRWRGWTRCTVNTSSSQLYTASKHHGLCFFPLSALSCPTGTVKTCVLTRNHHRLAHLSAFINASTSSSAGGSMGAGNQCFLVPLERLTTLFIPPRRNKSSEVP